MEFSALLQAISEVQSKKDNSSLQEEQNIPTKVDLNPDTAAIQQKQKQAEISKKARKTKNKKIERSMGYYDRAEQKEKLMMQQTKNKKKQQKGSLKNNI